MTSPITSKACEAWFLLEAADMRGLPAPFVVKAYADRVELQVRPEDFDRWAEAIEAQPGGDPRVIEDGLGGVQRIVVGELHEMAVTVSSWQSQGVTA